MTKFTKTIVQPQKQTSWDKLLTSIPDGDLDLLISAGEKMSRGEAVLNARELDACTRWYPQLDLLPLHQFRARPYD